jgi:hypothetical protein
MAAIPHELVELVPEQQQAFHLSYFLAGGVSDCQFWRAFSDQFL